MNFGTIYELAEYYNNMIRMVHYPERPIIEKPRRESFSNNEKFGRALDKWEEADKEAKESFRAKKEKYNELIGQINSEFRKALLEHLDVSTHPNANKLYDMAWERGHHSGFYLVAEEAEHLANLIK